MSIVNTLMQNQSEIFKAPNPFTGDLALFYKGLESVLDYAIYVIDPDGFVRSWSTSAARVKGFSESEILNQHHSKFYLPEYLAKGIIEYEMQMAREKGRYENENWRLRSNGEKFWADEIIYPIYENSKLTGYLKITRDVSLRKQAHEKLIAEKDFLGKSLTDQLVELQKTNEKLQNEIREKELAQAKLHISEQRYRILTELTQNIIWLRNAEGKFTVPQLSWEQYTGQRFDQYKDMGWLNAVHPDDKDSFYTGWQHAVKNHTPYKYSYRLRSKTGEYRYVIAHAAPIFDRENNVSEWIGSCLDIHELKQVENALRETTINMNLALQASGMGIWNWNVDKDDVIWDTQMYQLFGIKAGQFNGTIKAFFELIHPDDRESLSQIVNKVLQDGNDYKADFRVIWPDGSIHYLSVRGKIFNNQNQPARFTGVCWDISAQKRLEAERAQAVQQAESYLNERIKAAEEHKAELEKIMQTLCHEIRNPLNGIQGALTWLRDISINLNEIIKLLNPSPISLTTQLSKMGSTTSLNVNEIHENLSQLFKSILEIIDVINDSIEHLNDVATNMLEHAKLEAGKVKIIPMPFDLQKMISALIKTQRSNKILLERGVTLLDKIPEEKILIKGDSARLKIIILNLIINAIKFTNKGEIIINLQKEPVSSQLTSFRITVSDTGIGMTEDEQKKLFNRFSQIKESNPNVGAGLGLYIVKGYIDAMNGTIIVASKKDKGTTFVVTIPLQNLTEEEIISFRDYSTKKYLNPEITTKPELLKSRILIVEDNLVNQKVLMRYLQAFGYEFDIANNGKEALELLKQKRFDLVLMDIQMPVMNGITATKAIRAMEKGYVRKPIPIIAVSADASEQIQALDCGMNDFIVKPVNQEALNIKIIYWLNQAIQSRSSFSSLTISESALAPFFKPPAKKESRNITERKESPKKQRIGKEDDKSEEIAAKSPSNLGGGTP